MSARVISRVELCSGNSPVFVPPVIALGPYRYWEQRKYGYTELGRFQRRKLCSTNPSSKVEYATANHHRTRRGDVCCSKRRGESTTDRYTATALGRRSEPENSVPAGFSKSRCRPGEHVGALSHFSDRQANLPSVSAFCLAYKLLVASLQRLFRHGGKGERNTFSALRPPTRPGARPRRS